MQALLEDFGAGPTGQGEGEEERADDRPPAIAIGNRDQPAQS